jgi:dipeptidyl aminopeptidase/acylaminoacyl peptidase
LPQVTNPYRARLGATDAKMNLMRSTILVHVTLSILLFSYAPGGAAEEEHFPTNEEMRHFRLLSDPRLSPDGTRAVVVVNDATADGGKSHLWLVDCGGGSPRQLTYSADSDRRGESAPRWMPDGQAVLFLAHRGDHAQLFRLPLNGGEAKLLEIKVPPPEDDSKAPDAVPPPKPDMAAKAEKPAELALEISSYDVSPDGKWIGVIGPDPQTPGEKKQKDDKADAVWVDHESHGSRLYIFEPGTGSVTAVPVPVDLEGLSWSEDGARLVALASGPHHASDLGPSASAWMVSLADASHPQRLSLPSTTSLVSWSLDGRSLFYLAQARREAPPGYEDLFRYDLAAGTSADLSDGFDGSVGRAEPIGLKNGGVVQAVERGVEQTLARYDGDAGAPQILHLPASVVTAYSTNARREGWIFLGSSGGGSPDLYFSHVLGGPAEKVAIPPLKPEHVKGGRPPKRIEWKNEGLTIQGLLYLPPEASSRAVALVVDVHGGPTGAFLDRADHFVDFLLGQGWAVLRCNPRGSTGRGPAFVAANKNDLGGADYRDIMAGVDFVLKTERIDPDRLALMGYSYGGEMAGFVEGKTTRFKAIVSGAPVIDQNSEYGTEDGSWYDRWYYGKPWEHAADAWRQSPLSGVGAAKTPFLLLQGQDDEVDPPGQSQEMYRALRQVGVSVDLVMYPRENHGPLARAIFGFPTPEPWHGFDARQHIVAFMKKAFREGPSVTP